MIPPKTLVIQPVIGIGDMIWHLQYIRAIVRETDCGPVYLITRSRTHAKTWLHNEPTIVTIEYIDHRDRVITSLKLRAHKFTSAWIMHNSFSYAYISHLAGIPKIYGLGRGSQKFIISNKPLAKSLYKKLHLFQMDALMQQLGIKVFPQDQIIKLDEAAVGFIDKHYGHYSKPHITFGVGASEDFRTWPPAYFIELAMQMDQIHSSTFFICGSQAEQQSVQMITDALKREGIQAVAVDHLNLSQVFALIAQSQLFIGNDSSLLNAAACLAVPSVGIFGASPILTYSPYMYGINPEGLLVLRDKQGMLNITPQQVVKFLYERNLFKSDIEFLVKY